MLEDFTRLNEVFGINEPMFLPKEENVEYLSVRTEEEKKQISEWLKEYYANNPVSEETRKKLSKASKGRKYGPEYAAAVSKRMMGNKNGQGAVFTEERRKKISEANKGNTCGVDANFLVTYLDGTTEFITTGLRKWCRDNGHSTGTLYTYLNGKRKKYKNIKTVEKLSKTP